MYLYFCFQAISSNASVQRANAAMSPGMETDLFGCFSDPLGFVMSLCCGCVVSGFTAASLDDRECTPCDILTNNYQVRRASMASVGTRPFVEVCTFLTSGTHIAACSGGFDLGLERKRCYETVQV